jgi:nitrogen-specific signal transduction histidine kinase
MVESDLRFAFYEIIQNAMDELTSPKWTGPLKEIMIRVSVTDGYHKVSVMNRGVPPSVQAQSSFFNPFYSTKGKAGLSLATASTYLMNWDCKIEFESNEQWSSFHILIPR